MLDLNFLRSSTLLLLLFSSCALDTLPKSHDVCEDTGIYLFHFIEVSGDCGDPPDELGQLLELQQNGCEQSVLYVDKCNPVLRRTCPDYNVDYALTRVSFAVYHGYAELHTSDCNSLYNVSLTRISQ